MNFLNQTPQFLKFVLAFVLAGGFTWIIVPVFIQLAMVLGFIDNPGSRRVHKDPTPKGGGIAIYLAVLTTLALEIFVFAKTENRASIDVRWFLAFAGATTVLIITGLVDDRFDMPAKIKLLLQALAAVMFIGYSGNSIGSILGVDLPYVLDLGVSVFWIVALINAFNLIDGMDGLCSGLAMISATGVALAMLVAGNGSVDAVVPLAIAGGSLGFLFYNYHPAKVFLGDTGSMFLGFSLAVVSLPSNKTTLAFSMAVPLLVAGVPLFDTLLAFWRRWMRKLLNKKGSNGESIQIFGADKEHLHHRLLGMGFSQRKVAVVLYIVAAVLTALMLVAMLFRENAFVLYLIGFALFIYVLVKHIALTELWDTGMAVTNRLASFRGRVGVLFFYLTWDLLVLIAAAGVAYFIFPENLLNGWVQPVGSGLRAMNDVGASIFLLTIPMVIFFAMIVISGAYRRVWSRAGMRDFSSLLFALGFAGLLYFSVESFRLNGFHVDVLGRTMIFSFVATFGCFSGRLARIYLRVIMLSASENEMHYSSSYARRVVIYGCGKGCQTLLRDRMLMDPEKATLRRIVGIVTPDPVNHGKIMKGIPIFGDLSSFSRLMSKFKLHEIIVSESTSAEERDQLMQISKDHEIDIYEWRTSLEPFSGIYRPTFASEAARKIRIMKDHG